MPQFLSMLLSHRKTKLVSKDATAPSSARADLADRSVSVLIATMDRPKLLRRAIDGVLSQAHEGAIEIVLCYDNDQPDMSLEMVDGDRSIRVITNTNSKGLAGARNTGVAAASHPWIAFCDDDDEWLPGKLAAQFAALEQTPGARVATTGIFIHYKDTDTARIPDPALLTFTGFINDRMTDVHPSATLASAELIAEIGDVDETIPGGYGEDYDWLLRAAKLSEYAVAPEPLVRVYWHGGSYFFEKWKTIDEALEFLVNKYPAFHDQPEGLARIRGQQAVAKAAMGDRVAAVKTAFETFRLKPTEKRVPVALVVAAGVPAGTVLKLAHKLGKGI